MGDGLRIRKYFSGLKSWLGDFLLLSPTPPSSRKTKTKRQQLGGAVQLEPNAFFFFFKINIPCGFGTERVERKGTITEALCV